MKEEVGGVLFGHDVKKWRKVKYIPNLLVFSNCLLLKDFLFQNSSFSREESENVFTVLKRKKN